MSHEDLQFGAFLPRPDSPRAGGPCLSEEDCRRACQGALGEEETLRVMEHAADCSRCAGLLREQAQMLDGEATAEEQAVLAQLPSGSMRGISRLAARMARSGRTRTWLRTGGDSWWLLLVQGFAVACVLVAVLLAFERMRPPSSAALLAEAYDAARPSEMRVPGSTPGEVASATRGSASTGLSSTALLQWKLRVQQRFDKDANDAAVRRELGQIALVEHDASRALQAFEMARVLDPKLPHLSFDLATAHFELGEATDQQLEFDRAIDLFSQYLEKESPGDPVALYDRALAWEHVGASGRAIADLTAALEKEKNPAWRQAIQRHIDRLHAVGVTGPGKDAAGYEASSDAAIRLGLPARDAADASARASLLTVARIGEDHQDGWLEDMLQHAPTASEMAAERELAAALAAYERGDSDESLRHAQQAATLFTAAGNQPGQMRAALQSVYALQSTGKAALCLEEAERLAHSPAMTRYARMQLQLSLELSSCHMMRGDSRKGLQEAQESVQEAQQHVFPVAGLRAAGFLLADQFTFGRLEAASRTGSAALRSTAAVGGASVQRYQLFHDMEEIARRCRLRFTARGFSEEAAKEAAKSGNARVSAYALEDLATAQMEEGDLSAAQRSFALADRALAELPAGPARELYRADWQTDRAAMIARRDGLGAAITAEAGSEGQFSHFAMVLPRTRFYTEYAALLREHGDVSSSLEKVWQAVDSSEASLGGLQEKEARQGWLNRSLRSYQVLTADLIDAGQVPESLAAWQWIRSAPFAPDATLSQASIASAATRMTAASPPGPLSLVYGRLEDQYVVWIVGSHGAPAISVRRLAIDPDALESMADTFVRMCADPNSSRGDLQRVGERLSAALLDPVRGEIAQSVLIDLSVDDSLRNLPFAALPLEGTYFGLQHALRFEQPTARQPDAEGPVTQIAGNGILLLRGATDVSRPLPSSYDETATLTERFPSAAVASVRLTLGERGVELAGNQQLVSQLKKAEVIHYSGHGLDENAAPGSTSSAGDGSVLLSAGTLLHCRLAVLAACRTLGEREEDVDRVSSIAGVVLNAGARSVLAARWDVDSRITQEVMLKFYEELATKHSPEEALQAAMRSVQLDPGSSHPYFWSPFQLVRPAAISISRSSIR